MPAALRGEYLPVTRGGCPQLERLYLASCDGVSEAGVLAALLGLPRLVGLDYHQRCSVLEILIRWDSVGGNKVSKPGNQP